MKIKFAIFTSRILLIREIFLSFSLESAIRSICLILILTIAAVLRLLPSKFGFYISEFDPYLQLYATKVIITSLKEKGLSGIFSFFNHHIDLTWQPEGVELGIRYFPGVPYTGALIYIVLLSLGFKVSIEEIAMWLPVFMGLATIFGIYLIGREVKNEFVGLLSALIASLLPAFISRSNFGWFDTECVGMPALIFSLYFYIKSIKKCSNLRSSVVYAFLAGLFAGYMSGSWGAFSYLAMLYAIYPMVLLITNNLSREVSRLHIITVVTMMFIANVVPRNRYSYMLSFTALLIYLSILICLFHDKFIKIKISFKNPIHIGLIAFFFSFLFLTGLSIMPTGLSSRHLFVVNPFYTPNVFIKTVQEQSIVNVGAFIYNYNVLIPFLIFGFYILTTEVSPANLLFVIITLSMVYASSTFVRIFALSSPIIAIVSSIGIEGILYRIYSATFRGLKTKKFREGRQLSTFVLVFSLIIILLFSGVSYKISSYASNVPPTIASASLPISYNIDDWLEALAWIKDNTPRNSVIVAWWDYGYWISYIAGRKSVADNGTLNMSRISILAEMFLSNESKAFEILKKLNADYVLIFLGTVKISYGQGYSYYTLYGFGEESKFIQMARIIDIPVDRFIYSSSERIEEHKPMYKDEFWNTFLGKLIPYEYVTTQTDQTGRVIDLYVYSPKYPENDYSSPLTLVFRSSLKSIGEVLIYKVNI